jgi:hypothetical protein
MREGPSVYDNLWTRGNPERARADKGILPCFNYAPGSNDPATAQHAGDGLLAEDLAELYRTCGIARANRR